ncbi:MAG: response regulator transcription factor [Bacteroidetes bacterium]|nr:response regulator transcription factor [Bacteroidota bacterium]MBS1739351.1 response regulator transcription factor [Bacteroidota bacterium]
MKVLIVEDEPGLANTIAAYLSADNYQCEIASTISDARNRIESFTYDCILLDLMLPDGNGLTLLSEIKDDARLDGVIIISAKGELEDKIKGLKLGADDYLSKPFHLPELAARIHSLIRRRQFANADILHFGELNINLNTRTILVAQNEVVLTPKEFDLLIYFIGNKNRVLSKNSLAERLSGDAIDVFDSYDFVYAHIKNLKKKLQDAGCPNYLKTLYGIGYKWQE